MAETIGWLLNEYRLDGQRRGLRPRSIVRYTSAIRSLARTADPTHIFDVTTANVEAFLDARNITARTRYTWISAFHGFYAWAIRMGHTDVDPTATIIRPKLRRTLPRPIGDDDLAMALQVADPQMRAWLSLAAFAGLRCAEIAELQRDSILEGVGLLRVEGKGGHERLVPLHDDAWAALRAAGLPRQGPVFRRPGGQPWTPPMVSRTIAVFFDDIAVDATAHCLRHWFATKCYAASHDLRVVQNLLGHASPTTTAIYTAFSTVAATEAVRALSVVSSPP